ncbi:MAG: hypothetical protein M3540_02640 [Actinomycetota bacterium]|nr:hypothetical protein [Actinomycetota bacterium]
MCGILGILSAEGQPRPEFPHVYESFGVEGLALDARRRRLNGGELRHEDVALMRRGYGGRDQGERNRERSSRKSEKLPAHSPSNCVQHRDTAPNAAETGSKMRSLTGRGVEVWRPAADLAVLPAGPLA